MKKLIPLLLLSACSKPVDPAASVQESVDLIASIEEHARVSARVDTELIRDLRASIRRDCEKLREAGHDHPACR